jgi:hypothetical protein
MNDIQDDRHHTAVVHPYEHLWCLNKDMTKKLTLKQGKQKWS